MKYLFLLFAVPLLFACNSEYKLKQKRATRETLKLNFNSNILSTSPKYAKTDAEKFVRDLMFETLCNNDSSSTLFTNIDISQDSTTYSFTIDTTRRLSNGHKVNSKAFKAFFEALVDSTNETSMAFFRSIYNQQIKDGALLSDGISFKDERSFTITLKSPFNIIKAFSSEPFYFSVDGHGTGLYINTIADDDILFALERINKIEQGVNYIQIRFIKSQKEMLEEFLSGNLDILESRYMMIDTSVHKIINTIIDDKYDGFNVSYLKSGYINYYSFYHMYDSATLSKLVEELEIDSLCLVKKTDNHLINMNTTDSSFVHASLVINNLGIKKKNIYIDNTEYEYFVPKIIEQNHRSNQPYSIGIHSIIPDKYFYTNDISELSNYQTLSEQIKNIRFKPIVQF